MRLWLVAGALLSVGLVAWWLSGRAEHSTDRDLVPYAESPSTVAEPTTMPSGRAPEKAELVVELPPSQEPTAGTTLSPGSTPQESSAARVLETPSEIREDARREVELDRLPGGVSRLDGPSQGELASLDRDRSLYAEPPPEILEELQRASEILPPQDVLDELRRKSEEVQPTSEQLERLWREANIQPSPEQLERLEELRRQSEIR